MRTIIRTIIVVAVCAVLLIIGTPPAMASEELSSSQPGVVFAHSSKIAQARSSCGCTGTSTNTMKKSNAGSMCPGLPMLLGFPSSVDGLIGTLVDLVISGRISRCSWSEIKLCYKHPPGDPRRPACCDADHGPKSEMAPPGR